MKLSKLRIMTAWVAACVVMASCGGGEEASTASPTALPTRAQGVNTPVPTGATQPAATVASTIAPPLGGLNPLKAAPRFPPIELDNIRYGGKLVRSDSGDVPHWDPKFNQSGPMSTRGHWFYEKLMNWEPNPDDEYTHLVPELAESWKASPDFTAYTFSLRKGVRWHDIAPVNGREMVADDVVFSLNRYREKDSAAYPKYSQVESIEAPDKYTVVIKLKEPNSWAVQDLFGQAEYIVAKEAVEASRGNITDLLIGTGAFAMRKWVPRVSADGVRHAGYWGKDSKGNKLPYLDTLELKIVNDSATILAAFRTGQLDQPAGLSDQAVVDSMKTTPGMRVYFIPVSGAGNGLAFNTRKAPWNDVRVRRAFGMALNHEKLRDNLFGDFPFVQVTPLLWRDVSNEPFTFEKLGPYYKFNPSEAQRLLTEAGFAGGKIVVGTPLTFITNTPQAPLLMQQFYKEQGIQFELRGLDPTTFYTRYFQRIDEDLALTYQQTAGDFSPYWFAQNKFKPGALENTSWIDDPGVNRVIADLKLTTDPAKVREYAKFLWDFDTQGVWNIWLPDRGRTAVLGPRVRNFAERAGKNIRYFPWVTDGPRTSP